MKEKIDSLTLYGMDHAEISHWETNIPCSVNYTFDKVVVTQMLSGIKEIYYDKEYVKFSPESVFLPPIQTEMVVDIHKATFSEPVECITLDISEGFIEDFYHQINDTHKMEWRNIEVKNDLNNYHYFTTQNNLCQSFEKLYRNRLQSNAMSNQKFLLDLNLKELTFLLLQTNARSALLKNTISDNDNWLYEVVSYIKQNFDKDIKINRLASIACKSESVFYRDFKTNIGCTPNQYVILERIKYAKEQLVKNDTPIQNLAFESGFNSVEHFSRKFKSVVGVTPKTYRKNYALTYSIEQ